MYRTKSVVLDNIKPYFVARVLHPKKAKKKKKKSLNSQLASDRWRFPAFLLVKILMYYSITFTEFFPKAGP